jgi:hypothetical protein
VSEEKMTWRKDWATFVLAIYGALMLLGDVLQLLGRPTP